jgi:hypothetical protein
VINAEHPVFSYVPSAILTDLTVCLSHPDLGSAACHHALLI